MPLPASSPLPKLLSAFGLRDRSHHSSSSRNIDKTCFDTEVEHVYGQTPAHSKVINRAKDMLSLSRDTRSSIGKLLHSSLKNRSIYIDSNGNSNATMQLRHDVSNKEGNDRDPKSYDPSLNDPSYLNKNHKLEQSPRRQKFCA